MRYRYLILALSLTFSFNAFSQAPPPEFMTGLKQFMAGDRVSGKQNFLIAINKDPSFFGSYNFMGIIYQTSHNLDSAEWHFKKSIALNANNINHTKELTYIRLINNYAYKHDFKTGFSIGCEALKLYPDNKNLQTTVKDLCQWAFYIKYDKLDPSYLATDMRDEFVVNSINEEYIIIRKIRVDDDTPVIGGQVLLHKNNANYDVFTCTIPATKKSITLNFKLNWDLTTDFGGKIPATDVVINNKKNPAYERIGAMLVADDKTDIRLAIEKIGN